MTEMTIRSSHNVHVSCDKIYVSIHTTTIYTLRKPNFIQKLTTIPYSRLAFMSFQKSMRFPCGREPAKTTEPIS